MLLNMLHHHHRRGRRGRRRHHHHHHHSFIHSFIHTEHLYSASSRELLRGAQITCLFYSITVKYLLQAGLIRMWPATPLFSMFWPLAECHRIGLMKGHVLTALN